jgi:hypothetical protein
MYVQQYAQERYLVPAPSLTTVYAGLVYCLPPNGTGAYGTFNLETYIIPVPYCKVRTVPTQSLKVPPYLPHFYITPNPPLGPPCIKKENVPGT